MCGIIAVVRRPFVPVAPAADALADELVDAGGVLRLVDSLDPVQVENAAARFAAADASLRTVEGLLAMLESVELRAAIEASTAAASEWLESVDERLARSSIDSAQLELLYRQLGVLRDANWSLRNDRLRAASSVSSLAPPGTTPAGFALLFSIHQALSALDRMEVRGRDSAGLEVVVTGHGLGQSTLTGLQRRSSELYTSGCARVVGEGVVFVYKAAAEIGELGDNTAVMRAAIRGDAALAEALRSPTVDGLVLGHTRWASIGIISEPNAHPQSSDELGVAAGSAPFVSAVLNGDVDNYADLITHAGMKVPAAVTTDAKVIPTLVRRAIESGRSADDAVLETVPQLEGSVAIAVHALDAEPGLGRLHVALRGSGQGVYVGLADDAFIVASEPYGVVEETSRYLRMDGETPSDESNPAGSRGQVIGLDPARAGELAGITRWSYDGSELPVTDSDVLDAQVTTRDIDRGDFPHYLLKELSDAPESFRKTLRGKLVGEPGGLRVHLDASTMPPDVLERLRSGEIDRVVVIGQGTAAVASQSLAYLLNELTADGPLSCQSMLATELSGFHLRPDMSDTLVIAVSQSGTTTDTNRTVDLVRGRGAHVIAIVNRRASDLCDRSDGVLFTSDGRDVEMSVASTKAFYSQIAACFLLSVAIAESVEGGADVTSADVQSLLGELLAVPGHLSTLLSRRDQVAAAAREFAPPKRYWAIVGNGPNGIAAREVRIKLSELCYKSIAADATEDKKHIDLSSEPLILVCAAGLTGSTADDVAKEVAIFRAHKATPIVIATEGRAHFDAAVARLVVPETDGRVAFVLSAMVGHLFGYEAALAIDAQARQLRATRALIESSLDSSASAQPEPTGEQLLAGVRDQLAVACRSFFDTLRSGRYDGHLEAATAQRVAAPMRYAVGIAPLDAYQAEFGKVGTPGLVLDDLVAGLTGAIEELTRPIDAIKHQAKTVTVGISRSDEALMTIPLVKELLATGVGREQLSYATLRSLAALDPAVTGVVGSTRYHVDGADLDQASLVVLDRRGISEKLSSRVDRDPRLRGTKHLVARERELMVTRGASDGRLVIIVPETKDQSAVGITLLHVDLVDRLPASVARSVLQGYRRRYAALRDAVTETEDSFRDDLLADQPAVDLLVDPILDLAEKWRT